MGSVSEWETFFDHYAPRYMDEPWTKGTSSEVDFLVDELAILPGGSILDLGCGTGRHAIEFASRGYKVTGVDISSGMLKEGQSAASEAGVEIEWIHADATRFQPARLFDAAVCLCEGSFGLLGSADDPYEHELLILRNLNRALIPGGRLVITAVNGLAKIRSATPQSVASGTFDPVTQVETFELQTETPSGVVRSTARERGFVPSELRLMLRVTGFEVDRIWGGTAGSWFRRTIELDEIEVMVVAHTMSGATDAGW
jgi:SAM-dependent methyltransferase